MKLSRPKYRKSRLISLMILVSYPLVVIAYTTQLAVCILYLASLPPASYLAAEYLLRARPSTQVSGARTSDVLESGIDERLRVSVVAPRVSVGLEPHDSMSRIS